MEKYSTHEGTIEITASNARESECMPDKPTARDVDVEITIGGEIVVPADPDLDDCLSGAAEAYVEEHPELAGWNLSPRWTNDESRESVTLTVPKRKLSGEVTLIPSDYDGSYGSWGHPDHWVSSNLLQELYRLDEAGEIRLQDVLGELSGVAAAEVAP